jgi:excisionase family DNA binding protein
MFPEVVSPGDERMNESTEKNGRLLGRADVAKIFGVSPSTITRWADAGKLPVVKTLGGHRRYDSSVVMELAHQSFKEQIDMEELIVGVPTMYADHHVLAVRNALLGMDGVAEVEASSAFKTVRVQFDSSQVTAQMVFVALMDAGYPPAGLGDGRITVPVSEGKSDPAWEALAMRTVETNPTDLSMSGEFRKY